MLSSISGLKNAHDQIITILALLASFIAPLLVSFGVDQRIVYANFLFFFLWVVYILWYRAKIVFQNDEIASFVETARGYAYLLMGAIAFSVNGFAMLTSPSNAIFAIFTVAIIFVLVVVYILPHFFFCKETKSFLKSQMQDFYMMLRGVGGFSIYEDAFRADARVFGIIADDHMDFRFSLW